MKKLALCFILILGIAASGCSGGSSGGSKSSATTAGANQEDSLNGMNLADGSSPISPEELAGANTLDPAGDGNTNGDPLGSDIGPGTGGDTVPDTDKINQVPEPGSLILLGSGLMGLALYRIRRPKK